MWDVVRFAEQAHLRAYPYKAVIVENVVDVAKWGYGDDGGPDPAGAAAPGRRAGSDPPDPRMRTALRLFAQLPGRGMAVGIPDVP